MITVLRRLVRQPSWPSIDSELIDLRNKGYLSGHVLNAGAGWRDIAHLVDGTLVNQDLSWPGDERTNIDIVSPIDNIPRPDNTFDAIICLAVLEHVEVPEQCVREFFRVVKPGGIVIASVPFLQPEHKVPTDFQRYTKDGLSTLFRKCGFEIEENKALFTVYHTLHWIVFEWLTLKNNVWYKILRVMLLVPLALLSQKSQLCSDKIASGFRIVVRKPLAATNNI